MSIADLSVAEFISRIAGTGAAPGAGAAGAVALALAAACAGKAVSISLKHRSDDSALQQAVTRLHEIAQRALIDADRDKKAFETYIKDQSPRNATQLVREAEDVDSLIGVLIAAIDGVETHIEDNMAGDLVAARALLEAARSIERHNRAESTTASVR